MPILLKNKKKNKECLTLSLSPNKRITIYSLSNIVLTKLNTCLPLTPLEVTHIQFELSITLYETPPMEKQQVAYAVLPILREYTISLSSSQEIPSSLKVRNNAGNDFGFIVLNLSSTSFASRDNL